MKARRTKLVVGLIAALVTVDASPWGPDGHHTVGAIADQLIAGSNAAVQVQAILGGLSLQDAAVWADCAKGVDPSKGFAYTSAGVYPECKIFETPAGEAEMIDFVRRNDTNCARIPGDESCHKQYHYSDEAIQRDIYRLGDVGTSSFDVVAAVAAVTHVLQGDSAPAPFNIKDKREALLLLAHYVGDIHQPLHVGAVYLNAAGEPVDPDSGTFDPATKTVGANDIITVSGKKKTQGANLHHTWDQIPTNLMAGKVNAVWLAQAKAVPGTPGDVYAWPTVWATDSLGQAQNAFSGLQYSAESNGQWTVALPSSYSAKMAQIKRRQLIEAGARLAQILQAIWP